jgi:hypothetical protein
LQVKWTTTSFISSDRNTGTRRRTSRNALGITVPFNPTGATETVSAALAFAKCGITIRHSELPVLAPLARLMTA